MRSIKHECLNRVIPFGERHLPRTIAEFVEYYHGAGDLISANLRRSDNDAISRTLHATSGSVAAGFPLSENRSFGLLTL